MKCEEIDKNMKKNNNLEIIGIFLMIMSSVCTCLGQLFWKLASVCDNYVYYLIGFILYGLGAFLMIIAFKFGELSVLHPMLSFGFILSIILGVIFLEEAISINKVIGIGLIVIGMFYLGQSSRAEINK